MAEFELCAAPRKTEFDNYNYNRDLSVVRPYKQNDGALQCHCHEVSTLEERRKRGDLIEMYKLLTEKEDVDDRQFSGRRTVSTGCEVIITRCSFPASEQLSGNRS